MASTNKVMRVFLDVNMGKGHIALTTLAMKHDVSVFKLQPHEHIVFVNRKGDKIKVFSANNVISYLRQPNGHVLDLGALQYFPECFGADGFEYSKVLEKVLRERLKAVRSVA